ncbi:class C sortase [Bacillus thuringiensis]|uniref:class C sortase n=1 Tax=Bacillus TaxID=1386 RepID=UPI000BFA63E2|nr:MULTISPECIES: class C sortase [Bacillus]HDR4947218.1 class C sortase [Bacillus cereus]PFQ84010.1 class C sortase [Bacillus thuringiensis]PGK67059.1 class C sortase [Bacillus thuringiensis]PGM29096.1 class C sortase [Bacillus thuringiensis]PGP90420.1 class C sortase [Bacillus thuringiensis]
MKRNLVLGGIFLFGLGVFLYPTISNWLATRAHYSEISSYDKKIKELQKKEVERREKEAAEYNKQVQTSTKTFTDPFSEKKSNHQAYADALNLGDVMGYIEISKINIKLPIYQGTSEEVLSRGIGHLDFSSLPIGGENTHTILTGHRGLPSAKLFTDLDKLSEGDLFYIHSLDKVLAYKVDQIKVVLPHETDDLQIVQKKDYTTLITCTPYGVNTNRLLVRGVRVELNEKEKQKVSTEIFIFNKWTVIVPILLLCVFLVVIYKKRLTR